MDIQNIIGVISSCGFVVIVKNRKDSGIPGEGSWRWRSCLCRSITSVLIKSLKLTPAFVPQCPTCNRKIGRNDDLGLG